MSKEEGGGGGGGESQAQYVGPYRLEKTLGKGQTGEWSFIQGGGGKRSLTSPTGKGVNRMDQWLGVDDSGPSGLWEEIDCCDFCSSRRSADTAETDSDP